MKVTDYEFLLEEGVLRMAVVKGVKGRALKGKVEEGTQLQGKWRVDGMGMSNHGTRYVSMHNG